MNEEESEPYFALAFINTAKRKGCLRTPFFQLANRATVTCFLPNFLALLVSGKKMSMRCV